MSKINSKYSRPQYDEDGVKRASFRDIKREKDQKRRKNLSNALRSRDLDMIRDLEED